MSPSATPSRTKRDFVRPSSKSEPQSPHSDPQPSRLGVQTNLCTRFEAQAHHQPHDSTGPPLRVAREVEPLEEELFELSSDGDTPRTHRPSPSPRPLMTASLRARVVPCTLAQPSNPPPGGAVQSPAAGTAARSSKASGLVNVYANDAYAPTQLTNLALQSPATQGSYVHEGVVSQAGGEQPGCGDDVSMSLYLDSSSTAGRVCSTRNYPAVMAPCEPHGPSYRVDSTVVDRDRSYMKSSMGNLEEGNVLERQRQHSLDSSPGSTGSAGEIAVGSKELLNTSLIKQARRTTSKALFPVHSNGDKWLATQAEVHHKNCLLDDLEVRRASSQECSSPHARPGHADQLGRKTCDGVQDVFPHQEDGGVGTQVSGLATPKVSHRVEDSMGAGLLLQEKSNAMIACEHDTPLLASPPRDKSHRIRVNLQDHLPEQAQAHAPNNAEECLFANVGLDSHIRSPPAHDARSAGAVWACVSPGEKVRPLLVTPQPRPGRPPPHPTACHGRLHNSGPDPQRAQDDELAEARAAIVRAERMRAEIEQELLQVEMQAGKRAERAEAGRARAGLRSAPPPSDWLSLEYQKHSAPSSMQGANPMEAWPRSSKDCNEQKDPMIVSLRDFVGANQDSDPITGHQRWSDGVRWRTDDKGGAELTGAIPCLLSASHESASKASLRHPCEAVDLMASSGIDCMADLAGDQVYQQAKIMPLRSAGHPFISSDGAQSLPRESADMREEPNAEKKSVPIECNFVQHQCTEYFQDSERMQSQLQTTTTRVTQEVGELVEQQPTLSRNNPGRVQLSPVMDPSDPIPLETVEDIPTFGSKDCSGSFSSFLLEGELASSPASSPKYMLRHSAAMGEDTAAGTQMAWLQQCHEQANTFERHQTASNTATHHQDADPPRDWRARQHCKVSLDTAESSTRNPTSERTIFGMGGIASPPLPTAGVMSSEQRVAKVWLDAEQTFAGRVRKPTGNNEMLGTKVVSASLRPRTSLSLSLQSDSFLLERHGANQDVLGASSRSNHVQQENATHEPGTTMRLPIVRSSQERSLWERVDAQSQRGVQQEEQCPRAEEAPPLSPAPPIILNLHLGYSPSPARADPFPPAPSDKGAEAAVLVEGLTTQMRQLQRRLQHNIEGMKLAEMALLSPELSDSRATPGSASMTSAHTPPSNTSSTIRRFREPAPEFPKSVSPSLATGATVTNISPNASVLHAPGTPSFISSANSSCATAAAVAFSTAGMCQSACIRATGEVADSDEACARDGLGGATPTPLSTCTTGVASVFPRGESSPLSAARERASLRGPRADMEAGIGQKSRSPLGLRRTALLVWRRHSELQASKRNAAGAALTWTNRSMRSRAVLVEWRQAVRLVGYSELVAIARSAQRVQRRALDGWRRRMHQLRCQRTTAFSVFASWRRAARGASGAWRMLDARMRAQLHLCLRVWAQVAVGTMLLAHLSAYTCAHKTQGKHLAAWRRAVRMLLLGRARLHTHNTRLLVASLESWHAHVVVEARCATLGRAWQALKLQVPRGTARRAAAAWGRRRALGLGWAVFKEGCARSSQHRRWKVIAGTHLEKVLRTRVVTAWLKYVARHRSKKRACTEVYSRQQARALRQLALAWRQLALRAAAGRQLSEAHACCRARTCLREWHGWMWVEKRARSLVLPGAFRRWWEFVLATREGTCSMGRARSRRAAWLAKQTLTFWRTLVHGLENEQIVLPKEAERRLATTLTLQALHGWHAAVERHVALQATLAQAAANSRQRLKRRVVFGWRRLLLDLREGEELLSQRFPEAARRSCWRSVWRRSTVKFDEDTDGPGTWSATPACASAARKVVSSWRNIVCERALARVLLEAARSRRSYHVQRQYLCAWARGVEYGYRQSVGEALAAQHAAASALRAAFHQWAQRMGEGVLAARMLWGLGTLSKSFSRWHCEALSERPQRMKRRHLQLREDMAQCQRALQAASDFAAVEASSAPSIPPSHVLSQHALHMQPYAQKNMNGIRDVLPARCIESICPSLFYQSPRSTSELGSPVENNCFSYSCQYSDEVRLESDTDQKILEDRPKPASQRHKTSASSEFAHHGQNSALLAFRSAAPSQLRQHPGHGGHLLAATERQDSTRVCGESCKHHRVEMTLEMLSMTNDAEVSSFFDAASCASMSPRSDHGAILEIQDHNLQSWERHSHSDPRMLGLDNTHIPDTLVFPGNRTLPLANDTFPTSQGGESKSDVDAVLAKYSTSRHALSTMQLHRIASSTMSPLLR